LVDRPAPAGKLYARDAPLREALAIEIDSSLPAERVIRVLDQLTESHELPKQIRVDNGP